MNEENEKRLTDVIIDLGVALNGLRKDIQGLSKSVNSLSHRVGKLEEQQIKTNMALHEMRTSYMKLDKSVD